MRYLKAYNWPRHRIYSVITKAAAQCGNKDGCGAREDFKSLIGKY